MWRNNVKSEREKTLVSSDVSVLDWHLMDEEKKAQVRRVLLEVLG